MKSILPSGRLAAMALVLALPLSIAQNSAIEWHKVAAGGGTSTGGSFALSGTIGQGDAGATMAGGSYSLTGGFWAIPLAIQTPGGPRLTIATAPDNQISISWVPDEPGWILQESTLLTPESWTDVPGASSNPLLLPNPGGTRFYRLFKP